ncbi:MAG: 4Fe-4S binding protein [Desulfobacteraceae bacterium]|jgi:ferredoxin
MAGDALEKKYEQAAQVICSQGMVPFPVNETTISILKQVIQDDEEELNFIEAFRKQASQTMEQLKESSHLPKEKIEQLSMSLAKKGLIFNQPNSAGVMVYRLLPLMTVGLMEYTFMGELKGDEREQALAKLFEKLIMELGDKIQGNYDNMVPLFEASPPFDRTIPVRATEEGQDIKVIPVDKNIQVPEEFVLPSQSVEEIINKFDDIAVGRCFCRQRRVMLGEPCDTDAPLMNCFTFGKSARHTAAQGFAQRITKEEAFKIMKEAEEAGLVHKAFHPGSNVSRPETSICNCCKDCCDTLKIWRDGVSPLINSTYHLSEIDQGACSGCGICVERCPTEAIKLNENEEAEREESLCFGCGVCARFCPEEAISLREGLRKVFILPPRLRQSA